MLKVCSSCKHWEHPPSGRAVGRCHRNPPQVVVRYSQTEDKDSVVALWPLANPNDYCGEWEPV